MNKGMSELIAKLMLLGNKVKVVGDNKLVVTNNSTGKMTIVIRDGGNTIISDEYDDIVPLIGSDYSLVRLRKRYGVIYKADKLNPGQMYTELSRCALASNGVYNIIAKLDDGLYGVIDTDDKIIIPFYHSSINLYRTENAWVYVGTTWDCQKIYKDNGEIYGVTNVIGNRDYLIGQRYVFIFEPKKYNEDKITICTLDGNILQVIERGYLSKKGKTDEYYQLEDNSTGKVIMDKVYMANKYSK